MLVARKAAEIATRNTGRKLMLITAGFWDKYEEEYPSCVRFIHRSNTVKLHYFHDSMGREGSFLNERNDVESSRPIVSPSTSFVIVFRNQGTFFITSAVILSLNLRFYRPTKLNGNILETMKDDKDLHSRNTNRRKNVRTMGISNAIISA